MPLKSNRPELLVSSRVAHAFDFGNLGLLISSLTSPLSYICEGFLLFRPGSEFPNLSLQICNLQTFQRLTTPFELYLKYILTNRLLYASLLCVSRSRSPPPSRLIS